MARSKSNLDEIISTFATYSIRLRDCRYQKDGVRRFLCSDGNGPQARIWFFRFDATLTLNSLHSHEIRQASSSHERTDSPSDLEHHGGCTFPQLFAANSFIHKAPVVHSRPNLSLHSNNSPSCSLRPSSRPLLPTRRSSRRCVVFPRDDDRLQSDES